MSARPMQFEEPFAAQGLESVKTFMYVLLFSPTAPSAVEKEIQVRTAVQVSFGISKELRMFIQ